MFLQRLHLRDVRSIEDLELTFRQSDGTPRPWTFVLGQNGVGKSTILRAIALVSSGGEALAELVGDPDGWIRLGKRSATIELDYATAKGARRSATLVLRRGSGLQGFLSDNKKQLTSLDRAIEHADRNYFVVGYGVSRRNSSELVSFSASSPFRTVRAQNVATLFSADASLTSVQQWAIDLHYRRGAGAIDTIKASLDAIMPGVTFERIDREAKQLIFSTSDGILPLSALSDGYQAMAAWCGDVLHRITQTFSDYKNPLKARGVLLVDEIDLHLHPLWQRQLVTYLSRTLPNFQIVATTHSPLTAHQAGRDELYVLRRAKPRSPTRLYPFPGAPNELLLHQIIQSPIFGLDTLDSTRVNLLRSELRRLQDFPDPNSPEFGINSSSFAPPPVTNVSTQKGKQRRIDEIKRQLAEFADWDAVPAYLKPTNELLSRIQSKLSATSRPGKLARTGAKKSKKAAKRRARS
jgi:predicted ATPase